jgi:hypothetical protein
VIIPSIIAFLQDIGNHPEELIGWVILLGCLFAFLVAWFWPRPAPKHRKLKF